MENESNFWVTRQKMSANGRAKVSALPPNSNSDLPVRLSAACPLTGGWSPVYPVAVNITTDQSYSMFMVRPRSGGKKKSFELRGLN